MVGRMVLRSEDETTYNVSAQMQGDDRMTARIYKAVSWFGRTEILTQIRSDGRPGWCSVR